MTAFVYFFSHYSEMSDPVYVFSFAGGLILAFLIADEIRCGRIDMRIVAVTSLATFLVGNLVSVTIGYNAGSFRYTGFANNPNQLIFYIASISLLLAMYDKRFLVLGLPLLVYIGVLSGSDAYVASVTIGAISLVYVVFFYYQKTPLIFNIGVLSLLTAIVVISYGELVHEYLVQIWDEADEGGSRVALLVNAVRASLASPLFGWGAGSFSGIFSPFEGYEAHNNLLDLSMQFGFLVPLAIYGVIIIAMTEALKRRQYVIFAFIVSYLVSGIFHFSARHFVFWVEFGVFLAYISSPRNSVSGRLDEPSAKRVSCAE
ncbi:O-antigen ligase family protein [Spiribacter pallidus]|uniref:O-antigen ligase family protein n=1 Tax=Spiribacter pallidus TaxID=1987936 RepID=UPI00349F91A3